MQALFQSLTKFHYQHLDMKLVTHKAIFKTWLLCTLMEHCWFLWDAYGCILLCSFNSFKLGLTFWRGNPLYSLTSPYSKLFTARLLQMSSKHCSQIGVSNMRLSQQFLVEKPFLLLMAWPTSQFRGLIKAAWWRSWSCTMSLTDPQLSKIRNAQLVAFTRPINMH